MGQRGCGSCAALVTLRMWLSVLAGSILAPCGAAALRLGGVQDSICSWDPFWCGGTCASVGWEHVGLEHPPEWAVSWGAAILAGPCTAAG